MRFIVSSPEFLTSHLRHTPCHDCTCRSDASNWRRNESECLRVDPHSFIIIPRIAKSFSLQPSCRFINFFLLGIHRFRQRSCRWTRPSWSDSTRTTRSTWKDSSPRTRRRTPPRRRRWRRSRRRRKRRKKSRTRRMPSTDPRSGGSIPGRSEARIRTNLFKKKIFSHVIGAQKIPRLPFCCPFELLICFVLQIRSFVLSSRPWRPVDLKDDSILPFRVDCEMASIREMACLDLKRIATTWE